MEPVTPDVWSANRVEALSQTPEVQFRGVGKSYIYRGGATQALMDINFDIYGNEFVCLIGESGCGKSTLLHMIAGFEMPSSGEVMVRGERVTGPSHHRGVVFQETSLLPWLTVEKNITLGLDIRKQKPSAGNTVADMIELMGLNGFEQHYPSQLSGGMAQRAAIARALVNRPDVLLCDEPFGALDAFTRMKLQTELIRIWQKDQYTTIFVTHDIDEAIYLATRVVLLTPRPGRLARIFNVQLRRPRDRTSAEFIRLRGMIAKEFLNLKNDE